MIWSLLCSDADALCSDAYHNVAQGEGEVRHVHLCAVLLRCHFILCNWKEESDVFTYVLHKEIERRDVFTYVLHMEKEV